jgi:hypothetical protein
VTVLSTDDEGCSAEGLQWLIKSIFREDDLFLYAKSELDPILQSCSSYREANSIAEV